MSVGTTPNPAIASQPFKLTISGTNFDPASAEVLFRGALYRSGGGFTSNSKILFHQIRADYDSEPRLK